MKRRNGMSKYGGVVFVLVLVVTGACSAGGGNSLDPVAQARGGAIATTTSRPLLTTAAVPSTSPAVTAVAAATTQVATAPPRSPRTSIPTAIVTTAPPAVANTATTAPVPRPDIQRVDLRNALMPAGVCRWGREQPQAIQLVDGIGNTGDRGSDNYSEVLSMDVLGYVDISGDGVPEAVISTGCTGGGTAVDGSASVLSWDGQSLALLGGTEMSAVAGSGASDSRFGAVRLEGTRLIVNEVVQIGDDPRCCYTGKATVSWTYANGQWAHEVSQIDGIPSLQDASGLLKRYFLAAGARRYEDAWSMLSLSYQVKYGGFAKFTSFWNRVRTVGIDGVSEVGANQRNGITIRADVWFALTDGTRSNERIEVDIDHGFDNELKISDYRFIGTR